MVTFSPDGTVVETTAIENSFYMPSNNVLGFAVDGSDDVFILYRNYVQDEDTVYAVRNAQIAALDLFVDLYEYIDYDELLKCVQTNEKLFSLPISFTVFTTIGKASNVGSKPSMTVAEMFGLYRNMPDGACLFNGNDLNWIYLNE